jgi:hypothetical protein
MDECPISHAKVDFDTLPKTMRKLPLERGFPVPWFVDWIDGKPEFRAMNPQRYRSAIRERLCWVCGEKIGISLCFVAGPMCGINRTSSEPPSHIDCARWSADDTVIRMCIPATNVAARQLPWISLRERRRSC